MKTIRIYKREVLERTGFKQHPYKEVQQYIVNYDNKEYKNNHYEDLNNSRLKIKFSLALETRSTKELEKYIERLGRKESEKWLKETLTNILNASQCNK